MKTLSEKEFNGFNVNAMFTERAERAKKELSPLMQEIRKYIPQAEYGYHVESGEYPAFYGVRIEFTYNGIRDRKSTRLNSSHPSSSRMPSSA